MENAIKVIYSQIITRIEEGLEVIDHLNRSCLLFFGGGWGGMCECHAPSERVKILQNMRKNSLDEFYKNQKTPIQSLFFFTTNRSQRRTMNELTPGNIRFLRSFITITEMWEVAV